VGAISVMTWDNDDMTSLHHICVQHSAHAVGGYWLDLERADAFHADDGPRTVARLVQSLYRRVAFS